MVRVGKGLARGIVAAAVLLTGGRLGESVPTPLQRTLAYLRTQDFTPVFEVARRRVEGHFTPEKERRFRDSLFSMSGKWKALTRSEEAYARYVRRSFERCLLDPSELASLTEAVRKDWLFGVSSAENRLLGVVYRDLRPFRPELTSLSLQARYESLSRSLLPSVVRDLGLNAVSFAGSEAAVSLLAAVVASTGVAGEAAGAAALAGGPWTFGAGLAVGLAVGLVIDQTAGEAYEDLARTQIQLQVNDLRNRMIDQVYDALARAVISYRRLQEQCVRAIYEGRTDDGLAARR